MTQDTEVSDKGQDLIRTVAPERTVEGVSETPEREAAEKVAMQCAAQTKVRAADRNKRLNGTAEAVP
jgi:hypothetical protein